MLASLSATDVVFFGGLFVGVWLILKWVAWHERGRR
jgi:hypothetical protein